MLGGHFFVSLGAGKPDRSGDIRLVGKYGVLLVSQGQPKWGYSVFNGWWVHGVMPNMKDTARLAIYVTYHADACTGRSPKQTDFTLSKEDWKEAGAYPGDNRKTYFHYFLRRMYLKGELDDIHGIDEAMSTLSKGLVEARRQGREDSRG